jgi:hypothetical protein
MELREDAADVVQRAQTRHSRGKPSPTSPTTLVPVLLLPPLLRHKGK